MYTTELADAIKQEIKTMTEDNGKELAEWYGEEDIWNAVSFITASHYRVLAMKELDNRPQTPTDISNNTDIPHVSHVSRALTELKEKGLAELLVSEDVRKGRIHGITDLGRESLHKAEWLGDDE